MVYIRSSGNCNWTYIDNLSFYRPYSLDEMEKALFDTLSTRASAGYDMLKHVPVVSYTYKKPTGGMMLFAQGSEDPAGEKPYGPNFKAAIEKHGLGSVTEIGPVPNPMHAGKIGILYVWIVDHAACQAWWKARQASQVVA